MRGDLIDPKLRVYDHEIIIYGLGQCSVCMTIVGIDLIDRLSITLGLVMSILGLVIALYGWHKLRKDSRQAQLDHKKIRKDD